jgi:hypothetical protein
LGLFQTPGKPAAARPESLLLLRANVAAGLDGVGYATRFLLELDPQFEYIPASYLFCRCEIRLFTNPLDVAQCPR